MGSPGKLGSNVCFAVEIRESKSFMILRTLHTKVEEIVRTISGPLEVNSKKIFFLDIHFLLFYVVPSMDSS